MVSPLGNKVTEKDLRDYLATQSFYANSARVHELELVGIERPGWVQYYQFHVEAKHERDGWTELYGLVRDDERQSFDVQLFDNEEDSRRAVRTATAGCITRPSRTRSGNLDEVDPKRAGLLPVSVVLAVVGLVGLLAALTIGKG